jgi:DNA-binding CsgD family transcriptional regulator
MPEFHAHLGIVDAVNVCVSLSATHHAVIWLESCERDFTERDKTVLDVLRPHLVARHRRARRERVLRDVGAAVLAASDAGVDEQLSDVSLTPREWEIMRCVDAGKTNDEIAELLWITPGTVKKHLEHVYAKLGARSRTAALARLRPHLATRANTPVRIV